MVKSTKSEQRKRILLVALGGVFVFVLVYNLFLSPPSRPTRRPSNSNAPAATAPTATTPQPGAAKPAPTPKATGQPEEVVALLMQDLRPLDLRHATNSGAVEPDKERGQSTVFAYYVEPPKPPPPPPPPPPITLTGVTPASAVAGTPRRITLTVSSTNVPMDAQMLFDGGVRQSRRLNEHQIATELDPAEYASPRQISITIRSASDPKMFSTQTTFSIQPAPEPQFRYIGRLGEQALIELTAGKEVKRVKRGDTITGQWRVDGISDQGMEVTLTQYDIKRRVPLTEKTR